MPSSRVGKRCVASSTVVSIFPKGTGHGSSSHSQSNKNIWQSSLPPALSSTLPLLGMKIFIHCLSKCTCHYALRKPTCTLRSYSASTSNLQRHDDLNQISERAPFLSKFLPFSRFISTLRIELLNSERWEDVYLSIHFQPSNRSPRWYPGDTPPMQFAWNPIDIVLPIRKHFNSIIPLCFASNLFLKVFYFHTKYISVYFWSNCFLTFYHEGSEYVDIHRKTCYIVISASILLQEACCTFLILCQPSWYVCDLCELTGQVCLGIQTDITLVLST